MSNTTPDSLIPLPTLPPVHVCLWINTSIDIPETFDDDCFKTVEECPWKENSPGVVYLKIHLFDVANNQRDYHACGKALEAVVRSKYFQTHAKQMKFLELSGFWLDDWKPFLDIFARNQPKLMYLSLVNCHLTEQGARSLGWVLENNDSGPQIEALNFDFLRGSDQWISGLLNNTTVKTIVAKQLDCGIAFLDCLRKCCLRKFHFVEYNGFLRRDSSLDVVTIRICGNDQKSFWTSSIFSTSIEVRYAWGTLSLGIFKPVILYAQSFPMTVVDCWENFQRLAFQEEQPKELNLHLSHTDHLDPLFQTVMNTSYDVPVAELKLFYCFLTDQAAICLGRLLDTDTSGVNVETFIMKFQQGSKAWVPGLYKNKSIKTLHLERLDLWHSALHFIRITSAGKLENITLYNVQEELHGRPIGVDDGKIAASTNNTFESCKNLERFVCEYDVTNEIDRTLLSRKLCASIGKMLRSTHLKYLELAGIRTNLDYDFLKDAVFCREICLKNTDFEPHGMASLIDNNDGRLKRLCLDWEWTAIGWDKVVVLLEQTDLTFLDEFDAGRLLTPEGLFTLQRRFRQNKGPRKLAMTLATFDPEGEENYEREEIFAGEDLEDLGKSLSGNTRIERIKLNVPVEIDIVPAVMLRFLHLMCAMPSLKHLEISSCVCWEQINNETRQKWLIDLKKCQQLIVGQILQKSRWIDLSSWLRGGEDFLVMQKMFWRCKVLLSCDANDLPDGLWVHVFVRTATCRRNSKDVLFFLLRELPRLCQQASDQVKNKEPRFIVPHSPNCPACHKRQRLRSGTGFPEFQSDSCNVVPSK